MNKDSKTINYTNEELAHTKLQYDLFKEDITNPDALFRLLLLPPEDTKAKAITVYVKDFDKLVQVVTNTLKYPVPYNCYITPNPTYTYSDKSRYLHKLNCNFVYIDAHRTENYEADEYAEMYDGNGVPTQRALDNFLAYLEEQFFDVAIPHPSMIIRTGRGFQLYWKLKPASYNHKMIVFYNNIQRNIVKAFKSINYEDFKVDTSVSNANRVLRLAGTYNHSAGTYATIDYIGPERYTLTELSEWLFGGVSTGRKWVHYKKKKRSPVPLVTDEKSYQRNQVRLGMLRNRLSDLITLVCLRDGKMIGYRQTTLYIALCIMCDLKYNEDEKLSALQEINALFVKPLSSATITKLSKRHQRKNFLSETIIDRLNISEEEQFNLKTIVSPAIRKIRRDAKKKNTRTIRTQMRMEQIKAFKDCGLTQREIAKETGLNIRTVKNYYKMINNTNNTSKE